MDPEWSTWWYINTKHHHQPCLIFFDVFSIYFYCPYIWHNLTFYIWKYTLDPENTTQYHYQPSLLFSDFFYIFTVFPFSTTHLPYMEIYNGPWEHHLMSSPTISIFFYIFSLFFYLALPYEEMYNGPWKHHVTSSPTASIFYIFTFSTASLSIIGNAHWTLKTAHPTSSSTMSTIPYFFSWLSSIFLLFFILKSAHFLIWKCALDPENITQHHHQPFLFFFWFCPILLLFLHLVQLYLLYMEMCNGPWKQHHTPFFSLFLLFYLFVHVYILFMEMCTGPWNDEIAVREWSCYWNEKWNALWQEWKRMKEISFSCCRDLEWNRCHEWMKIHFIHSQ